MNKIKEWNLKKEKCNIEGSEEFVNHWSNIFLKVLNKKRLVKKFEHLFLTSQEEKNHYIKRIKKLIAEGYRCYFYKNKYIGFHFVETCANEVKLQEVEKLAYWLDNKIKFSFK